MILASIATDYSAPDEIKSWIECLFWFTAFCGALVYVAKQLKGREHHPANELLGQSADEITRRVAHLEIENKQVWEKMERDRVAAIERAGLLQEKLGALGATLESLAAQCALMNLKLDSIARK